jgi:hypothetical protein
MPSWRVSRRSKILEGWRPAVRRHGHPRLIGRRHRHPRQDQHGRVRDGLLDRELGVRPDAQPVGPRPDPRRLGGGSAARSPRSRRRWRSAPTPAARSASPPRSPARRRQADLRRRLPLRADRVRVLARPGRPVRAHGARRRAAARGDRRPRPADSTSIDAPVPGRRRGPQARTSTRRAVGVVRELGGEGYQAGRRAALRRGGRAAAPSSAPRSSRCPARTSSTRWPRTT